MSSKTPLQEMIEFLKETYTETIGEPAIKKAQSLLTKEKEIIMNAYTAGQFNESFNTMIAQERNPEEYFDQNFNKNEKTKKN